MDINEMKGWMLLQSLKFEKPRLTCSDMFPEDDMTTPAQLVRHKTVSIRYCDAIFDEGAAFTRGFFPSPRTNQRIRPHIRRIKEKGGRVKAAPSSKIA